MLARYAVRLRLSAFVALSGRDAKVFALCRALTVTPEVIHTIPTASTSISAVDRRPSDLHRWASRAKHKRTASDRAFEFCSVERTTMMHFLYTIQYVAAQTALSNVPILAKDIFAMDCHFHGYAVGT